MTTMYQAGVPPCLRTLEARKIEPAALLLAQLYPDMFAFTR
jgi:hypothetical protein